MPFRGILWNLLNMDSILVSTSDAKKNDGLQAVRVGVMRIASLAGAVSMTDLEDALVMITEEGSSELKEVLDELIERGDLCRYETGHEPVFAATALRRVMLAGRTLDIGVGYPAADPPSGSVADDEIIASLLGPPSWRAMASGSRTLLDFATGNGETTSGNGDKEEMFAWRALAERGMAACSLSSLPPDAPAQIRRLDRLTSDWDAAHRSRLDDPLRLWAGFEEETIHHDPAQARVVALPADARSVVVAGPGSGKTYTIRDRIAALLANGVPAPGITVIAYSKTAVSELRTRLAALAAEEPFDVTTMDSLAGRLSATATGTPDGSDYEDTIRHVATLVRDGDRIARAWLNERQHVILDEAQDIVGARRDLMMAVIDALPVGCGATVFCDPAQAIYGYAERKAGRDDPAPVDALLTERAGFDRVLLQRNHRTTDPALLRIAREGRDILDAAPDGMAALASMRALLQEICGDPVPELNGAAPMPTLSLFRNGHAAAWHAARMTRDGLTMRMTGSAGDAEPPILAPAWVGRAMTMLHGKGTDALSDAVASLSDDPLAPGYDELKRVMAGACQGGRYDTARMAAMMRVGTAPPLPDPMSMQRSSTIHSAKGREAQDVALYLPRAPEPGTPDAQLREEARLLYVGATRARRRLYVASERGGMSRQGTRFWRQRGNAVQVQITRHDATATIAAPDADRTARRNPVLKWQRETRAWTLHAETPSGKEALLATLPDAFSRDVATLCKTARPGARFIPVARGTLRVEWCTIARKDTLDIVPVIEGFVWINFRRQD